MAQWDALARLASRNLLRATRPIAIAPPPAPPETFAGPGPWDRATLHQWLAEGGEVTGQEEEVDEKLILFSGNDYMGLSSHPAIRKAAVKAAQEYGMGPRGSALICGYTTYHKLVEGSLAELKKKEDCLLCLTGFSANMAVMTALVSVSSLLSVGRKPAEGERIAVFSDALNHASIIDGIRLVERQQEVVAFVYKHCDMHHLDILLLFSMDVFKAHGTLVSGENGGGAPELFGCENDVDISVGTLSKSVGCQGGFIQPMEEANSIVWPLVHIFNCFASATALHVSKKERWRRSVIWRHVEYFASLTKLDITSPIISIVVGSEEAALRAGRHMLRSGFYVTPIRPPTVPQNSCRLYYFFLSFSILSLARLRITLSASHSLDDIKRLVDALSPWLPDKHDERTYVMASKL
uniref:serine C-palmitoyltransferase n=1 Tax=Oryza punctata TaxID=4537 RepID=A0A0E0JNP4_ORYPU